MLDELAKYVVATPMPFAVDLAGGEGMTLLTVDGQRIYDWCGYYGSKLIGHNHPALREPTYVDRLVLAANNKIANPDFLTAECLEYYRLLHRIAPVSMQNDRLEVYTVNSGAEAVENMLKYMVARFNAKRARQQRPISNRRFIYFDKAFHGRTVYALGITQTLDPIATKDFHGLVVGGNIRLPFPELDTDRSEEENLANTRRALDMAEMALAQMADEVVGIVVEPIQGAGGQRMAHPEFFRGLSELAHRHDVYLAFDEVQTGMGATGKMFGIDHYELPYPPIAVASGKKFGNGVIYMLEPLEDIGVLDSTWGGTLADMVRFVQEFKVVEEEGLIARAAELGEVISEGLTSLRKRYPQVVLNVRGLGLYQGFSLDSPARKAALIDHALQHHHTLLLGAGDRSIRLRPNLHVTEADIEHLMQVLDTSLAAILE